MWLDSFRARFCKYNKNVILTSSNTLTGNRKWLGWWPENSWPVRLLWGYITIKNKTIKGVLMRWLSSIAGSADHRNRMWFQRWEPQPLTPVRIVVEAWNNHWGWKQSYCGLYCGVNPQYDCFQPPSVLLCLRWPPCSQLTDWTVVEVAGSLRPCFFIDTYPFSGVCKDKEKVY